MTPQETGLFRSGGLGNIALQLLSQRPERWLQGDLSEFVISPQNFSINENLRKCVHTAALPESLETIVAFDGLQAMRNRQPLQQLPGPETPRTTGEHCQLHALIEVNGLLNGLLNVRCSGQTTEAQKKLRSLEHDSAWLQMTSPHLKLQLPSL